MKVFTFDIPTFVIVIAVIAAAVFAYRKYGSRLMPA